jgi:hypothetical protein
MSENTAMQPDATPPEEKEIVVRIRPESLEAIKAAEAAAAKPVQAELPAQSEPPTQTEPPSDAPAKMQTPEPTSAETPGRAALQQKFFERFNAMFASQKGHLLMKTNGDVDLTVPKSFQTAQLAQVGGIPGTETFERKNFTSWVVPVDLADAFAGAANKPRTLQGVEEAVQGLPDLKEASVRMTADGTHVVITRVPAASVLEQLFKEDDMRKRIEVREESTITVPHAALVAARSLSSSALHVKQH